MELTKHVLRTEKWGSNLSVHLCEKHYHEFDKWWNPEKFDWKAGSWALAQYCHTYFDTWWDSEKFNWRDSWALAKYCNMYFNKWWDPERFNWKSSSGSLAQYCHMHFEKWWNKEMFNWENGLRAIAEYCYVHAQVWLPAYIKSANLTKALLYVNYEALSLECILD